MRRKWLVSPFSQIILVGLVCFCTAGIFNTMLSLGSNGLDSRLGNVASVAVNVTFFLSGLMGGAVCNALGPRISMAGASLGYPLYAVSFYIYKATSCEWPIVISGGILGLCAGVLWSAQGQIMMSYPTEHQKGVYVSIFWVIFNLGSVLGGFIPFSINFHNTQSSLSPVSYLGLSGIMLIGSGLSFLFAPINQVVRDDGRPVMIYKYNSVRNETWELIKLVRNWKMICLTPLFLVTNFVYAYQFQGFNASIFSIRTRSLNTVFYWFAQMIGALALGKFLDISSMPRSVRGLYALVGVGILATIVWGCGLVVQIAYNQGDSPFTGANAIDFTDIRWGPLVLLYFMYGLIDAMFQTLAYWVMGSLDNDPLVLARYAGYYKSIQSLGSVIGWSIASLDIPYLVQLLICWGVLELSLPGVLVVVRSIKDSLYELHVEPFQSKD